MKQQLATAIKPKGDEQRLSQTSPTMGDTPAAKFQSHLEIKTLQPPSPPTRPFSLSKNQDREHQKTPFFKSRAGTRKSDTWIISVFVILHVVAFIATMVANDCWRNSHGDCALKALGRLSFQPLSENPLLGPSASASVIFFSLHASLFCVK